MDIWLRVEVVLSDDGAGETGAGARVERTPPTRGTGLTGNGRAVSEHGSETPPVHVWVPWSGGTSKSSRVGEPEHGQRGDAVGKALPVPSAKGPSRGGSEHGTSGQLSIARMEAARQPQSADTEEEGSPARPEITQKGSERGLARMLVSVLPFVAAAIRVLGFIIGALAMRDS